MADYVSTLTGSQIDAALTDMAYHNSEAYAVGERDGVAVDSGDVAYHNNAKYYALIATSTVSPGDISDAVRWDTDQTSVLTSLNKAQARANIAAGGSNANLLDNPWMTVNQRSIASLTNTSGFSYIVDRWKMQGSCGVSSDGLGLYQASGTQGVLRQYIEVDRLKSGEVYTLSIMLQDGTIYSATGTLTASTSTTGWQIESTLISGRLWGGVRCYASTPVVWDISFTTSDVSGVQIRAVKLELGTVSTLANDVPPNYAEELAKCQYYFRRLYTTTGMDALPALAVSATAADVINWNGGSQMRPVNGTVTYSGTVKVYDGSDHAVTAIGDTLSGTQRRLRFTTTGLTAVTACYITLNGNIDISCDL